MANSSSYTINFLFHLNLLTLFCARAITWKCFECFSLIALAKLYEPLPITTFISSLSVLPLCSQQAARREKMQSLSENKTTHTKMSWKEHVNKGEGRVKKGRDKRLDKSVCSLSAKDILLLLNNNNNKKLHTNKYIKTPTTLTRNTCWSWLLPMTLLCSATPCTLNTSNIPQILCKQK